MTNRDSTPLGTDGIINSIEKIHSNLALTQEKLQAAPDIMRPVYEDAIASVELQFKNVIESDEAASLLSEQRSNLEAQTLEIDSLVEQQIIDADTGEMHKERIRNADEYRLLNIVASTGAFTLGETVAIDPVPLEDNSTQNPVAQTEDSQKAEQKLEKTPVMMTLLKGENGTVLQIGKRGKSVRLSGAHSDDQNDYTDQRIELLQIFVDRPNETLNKRQIVDLMSTLPEGSKEELRKQYSSSMKWLKQLTFRSSPLVLQNGETRGASYMVNDSLALELAIAQGATDKPITAAPDNDQSSGSDIELTVTTSKKKPLTLEQQIIEGQLPLRETNVLVQSLDNDKDLLEVLGLPTISRKMADAINEASTQYDLAHGINRNTTDTRKLVAERKRVATDFKRIFDDEDVFLNYITNAPEGHPTFGFFDKYLATLGEDEWGILIDQVLSKEDTAYDIKGFNSTVTLGRVYATILPNGRSFEKRYDLNGNQMGNLVETTQKFDPVMRVIIEPGEIEYSSEQPAETLHETSLTPPQKHTDTMDLPLLTNKETPKELTTSVEQENQNEEWVVSLKKEVGEVFNQLEDDGLIFQGGLSTKIIKAKLTQGKSKFGTKKAFSRMEKNGLFKPQHGQNPHDSELKLRDVIVMIIQNTNQEILSKSNKRRQSQALTIIDECVAKILDKSS